MLIADSYTVLNIAQKDITKLDEDSEITLSVEAGTKGRYEVVVQ